MSSTTLRTATTGLRRDATATALERRDCNKDRGSVSGDDDVHVCVGACERAIIRACVHEHDSASSYHDTLDDDDERAATARLHVDDGNSSETARHRSNTAQQAQHGDGTASTAVAAPTRTSSTTTTSTRRRGFDGV